MIGNMGSYETPIMPMLVHLMVSPQVFEIFVIFFPSNWIISIDQLLGLPNLSSVCSNVLLNPSVESFVSQ